MEFIQRYANIRIQELFYLQKETIKLFKVIMYYVEEECFYSLYGLGVFNIFSVLLLKLMCHGLPLL